MPSRWLRSLLAILVLLPAAAPARAGEPPPPGGDAGPGDGGPAGDAGPGGDGGSGDGGAGDGSGPTVDIVAPADGEEVSGLVTIAVDAADGDGVARIEFRIDGMLRGSDGSPPYEHLWQTANYSPGEHTVEAVGYDVLDNPTEASVTVTVGGEGGGEADAGSVADGDGGDGGDGQPAEEPERVDPISWGCSAPGRGGGGGCGLATALGLALVLTALGKTAAGSSARRGRRK
jgi:Bacterial Ig domain